MLYNEEELILFVSTYLKEADNDKHYKPNLHFRSRSEHIKRVLTWLKRLLDQDLGSVRKDELIIATIFHDIGRQRIKDNSNHAKIGADIFMCYAKNFNWTQQEVNFIYYLIYNHSNKNLLKECGTPIELILLMEADLLDEEGALGVIFDVLSISSNDNINYELCYQAINTHSGKILKQDYLVTPLGKSLWKEKQELISKFLGDLNYDLCI